VRECTEKSQHIRCKDYNPPSSNSPSIVYTARARGVMCVCFAVGRPALRLKTDYPLCCDQLCVLYLDAGAFSNM
jgi:hypothetical protein